MYAELPAVVPVLQEPGGQILLPEELQGLDLQQNHSGSEPEPEPPVWNSCHIVFYLLVEPREDVLLRHHLKPVAVHLLSQVGVLALFQLDEGRHLGLEGLLAQTQQTLAEADQELLNLCLDKLGAARTRETGSKKKGEEKRPRPQSSAYLNLVACVSTVTENPSTPEVFLQVGYTWYLDETRQSSSVRPAF